jgi:hypothetical protein
MEMRGKRDIGLDAHASSCTLGVMMPSGKRVGRDAVGVAVRGAVAPRGEGGGGCGEREPGPEGRPTGCLRLGGGPPAGRGVYTTTKRGEYLGRLPKSAQPLAELLYAQMDALDGLKSEARKAMLAEAKRHPEFRLVRSCPGMGHDAQSAVRPEPAGGGRPDLPALPGASGWRYEAEPGEADPCSTDRFDRARGMANQGGLRPEETRGSVEEELTRAEAAEGKKSLRGVGPGISTVQGRASIESLGRASGPESHGIGYAPLESRTKPWAEEPPPSLPPHSASHRPGRRRKRTLAVKTRSDSV